MTWKAASVVALVCATGSARRTGNEGDVPDGSGAEGKNEHHVQQVNIKRVAAAPGEKFPRAGIDELSGGKRAGGGEHHHKYLVGRVVKSGVIARSKKPRGRSKSNNISSAPPIKAPLINRR